MFSSRFALAAAIVAAAIGSPAHATVLQISATGLVLRTDPGSSDKPGAELDGMLINTSGRYFAPVVFPETGQNVCRFTLIYRDFDADDITATLLKKPFTIGGTAFDPPVVMASVSSSGSHQTVRKATTTAIKQSLIHTGKALYFVELQVPAGANIETIGMQIDMEPTCG